MSVHMAVPNCRISDSNWRVNIVLFRFVFKAMCATFPLMFFSRTIDDDDYCASNS